jgi:hypothetical protein
VSLSPKVELTVEAAEQGDVFAEWSASLTVIASSRERAK